jgi:hypothetical protein
MMWNRIYQPVRPLQQWPGELRLRGAEWRFLLSADGMRSAEEIRRRLGFSTEESEEILRALLSRKLLMERETSLEEHSRLTALTHPGSDGPQSLDGFLGHEARGTADPEVPPFSPLPTAFSGPDRAVMSLKSVMDFILSHFPDGTAGQLAVYQVFIGIPTALLRRNGITTLRFHDDRLIEDAELQQAILENIGQSLQLECPPSVYSAVR